MQIVRRVWPVFVILLLAGAGVAFWPWLRPWLPHPALVRAWINYLVLDLNVDRWGPVATLLLVGLIELVWALNLGRKSGAFERQSKRMERVHAREIEVMNHQMSLLEDEQRVLHADLEVHQDLLREEMERLWTRFEEIRRLGRVSQNRLISLDVPNLSQELRGEWREVISRLERLEVASETAIRNGQSSLQQQRHADEVLSLGSGCYYLGQYERALTHYRRALDLGLNDPEALIDHAVVNLALNRNTQAVRDLDHALKLEESEWAYLYRGIAREQQGEKKRAIEDYSRAVRLEPELVDGYYRRGLLYSKIEEFDKALQDHNRVLELAPEHAGGHTARGMAEAGLDECQRALQDLDRGCALAPEWYEGYYRRGEIRYKLGMYDLARDDFCRVIDLAPGFGPGFMGRGNSLLAQGEYGKAAADYGRAIELEPRNAEAYCARGMTRAALREYRRAVEDYDRALAIDAGLAVGLANRGSAYEKLGECEQAIRDLDRAIALDPGLAVAYYNRGLAYGSLGEYDRASRDLNKAAELDPSLNSQDDNQAELQSAQILTQST